MALLSGARNDRNKHLAQKLFHNMKIFSGMTNSLTPASVLLANVYASCGDIEKATDIRSHLEVSDGKRKAGLAWTMVNGQVFVNLKLLFLNKKYKMIF